jgi:plasmid stabilization system protein ParE
MKFELVLSKLTQQQIKDAIDYYQSIEHSTVKDDFLNDFYSSVERLKTNPYYRFWTDKYRGMRLDKFPYIVFFRIQDNMVKIVSVFHTSQDPDKYPI